MNTKETVSTGCFVFSLPFVLAGILILSFGMTWLVQGNEFFLYKFFAPKTEAVRRDVFEQTKSYQQGMIQELQNMQFEYIKAEPEHKAALRSLILHRAADFPSDRLPDDLRRFISDLKSEGWKP
jgi:hypothetical protein